MIARACRVGWHDWTKWHVIREGRYVRIGFASTESLAHEQSKKAIDDGMGSLFKEQQRECGGCGLLQLRTEYA